MKFVEEWIYEIEQKTALYKQAFVEIGAASYIAKLYRTHLIKKKLFKLIYYNHFVKALTIQRYYRGFHARKMLYKSKANQRKMAKLQDEKAIIIQKYVRRYLAQLLLDRLYEVKDLEHEQRYNDKLLKLAQGQSRGVLSRWAHQWRRWMRTNNLKLFHDKALVIQRIYRGYHGRQRAILIRIMNSVRELKKVYRQRHKAVVKIQKRWRGYSTR